MGGKVPNYQIVYRDETLNYFKPGGYVFFQRLKEYGGGYWLGKNLVCLIATSLSNKRAAVSVISVRSLELTCEILHSALTAPNRS
ncbi:hypothetical protein AVE16_09365 [Salmonella enterica subsp. enterica serovar Thompson]|nr:hypothetical protein [Salmonella enterica subsp. enterica serovar Thompson]ECY7946969.1 hypothetical protein [Salmonella enterica subsp. enterica serovar Thompson]